MIHFANIYFLYLLIIIPVVFGLYLLGRRIRKSQLKKFGRLNILDSLMPDASKYMPTIKITLQLGVVVFVILALARPYVDNTGDLTQGEERTTRGIEIMVCLDVSNSMLASSTDSPLGISRLQRSKYILEKTIEKLDNDKIGLIVFAGEAYTQLPITPDFISAKMFLNSIDTEMVSTQGTAIGAAIDMAINSFNPESPFQKAIVVITDGENFEDDALEAASRASDAGIQVDVIGVGTSTPMPIPLKGRTDQYMTMSDGRQVETALNEKMAKEIANAGKGIYIQANSKSAVDQLSDQLSKLEKTEYTRYAAPDASTELYPIACVIAMILLIIDIILPYRKIKWLSKFNFFN